MTWRVEVEEHARKELGRLDRTTQTRILTALRALTSLEVPRSRGQALTGPLAGLWCYRVGGYRVVCGIDGTRLVVLVVQVGHRPRIYRRRRPRERQRQSQTGTAVRVVTVPRRAVSRLGQPPPADQ